MTIFWLLTRTAECVFLAKIGCIHQTVSYTFETHANIYLHIPQALEEKW